MRFKLFTVTREWFLFRLLAKYVAHPNPKQIPNLFNSQVVALEVAHVVFMQTCFSNSVWEKSSHFLCRRSLSKSLGCWTFRSSSIKTTCLRFVFSGNVGKAKNFFLQSSIFQANSTHCFITLCVLLPLFSPVGLICDCKLPGGTIRSTILEWFRWIIYITCRIFCEFSRFNVLCCGVSPCYWWPCVACVDDIGNVYFDLSVYSTETIQQGEAMQQMSCTQGLTDRLGSG